MPIQNNELILNAACMCKTCRSYIRIHSEIEHVVSACKSVLASVSARISTCLCMYSEGWSVPVDMSIHTSISSTLQFLTLRRCRCRWSNNSIGDSETTVYRTVIE